MNDHTRLYELDCEIRLSLRRHDLRENERLVAEALLDLSFHIGHTTAFVRQVEQIATLTGIRVDRVRIAIAELRRMQIIADVVTDDRGTTFRMQPDCAIWKCRQRVDGMMAKIIVTDLRAEASIDPAQPELFSRDMTLSAALAEVNCERMTSPSHSDLSAPAPASVPKNGNCASTPQTTTGCGFRNSEPPASTLEYRVRVKEPYSSRQFPKNGNVEPEKPTAPTVSPLVDDPDRWTTSAYISAAVASNAERRNAYIDPFSTNEHDLMERLRRALGDKQMSEHGGAWRRKCQRYPRLVRFALNELESRDDIRDRVHWMIDLMKRGPTDYAKLCQTTTSKES